MSAAPSWSQATPNFDLDAESPVDPYLVWAELSNWAGFGGNQDHVRVLFELTGDLAGSDPLTGKVREIFQSNPLNPFDAKTARAKSRYATANASQADLVTLAQAVDAGVVARFQLGVARVWPNDSDGNARIVPQDIELSAQRANALAPADGIFRTLGVVDDGCCLAHEWLREGNDSSFLLVWDQRPTGQPQSPWQRFTGVSYGEELIRRKIHELLQQHSPLGEPAERRFYAEVLRRENWGREQRTHGARVLHLAARSHYADNRRNFPLLFVQLPDDTVADTSGGSLGVYVLDGARYVVQRTRLIFELLRALGLATDYRTTINISLGSIAGPHDGSTITELALAEMLASDNRVSIVLAAGNTAGKSIHAVRRIAMGSSGRFDILAPPDNPRESYVEIWLPTNGVTVSADDFAIEVVAPNGQRSPSLRVGQAASLRIGDTAQASVIFARAVAQGRNGTMVLLALRSTRPRPELSAGAAPYGFWSIEVSTTLARRVDVHAWVERNDLIIGRRRPQQTRFVDDGCSYVNDEYTLSSIANGENVVVVGAYSWCEKVVTDYCANGPTRSSANRKGPDYYGPADQSASIPGVPVPGFFSGSWTRISGTSAAAPCVTRWIAMGRGAAQMYEVRTKDNETVAGIAPEDLY